MGRRSKLSDHDSLREQADRLREFISNKQHAGIISGQDAETIFGVARDFYREQGLFQELIDQDARAANGQKTHYPILHKGIQLMKNKLLDLYPDLTKEVRQLLMPSRCR